MAQCKNEKDLDIIREFDDVRYCQDENIIMEYCYNCKYNLKLYKHPHNKIKELKGSIEEEDPIFACSVFYETEGDKGLIVLEDKYGSCEMFEERGE